jgi:hypothetical protein
MEKVAPVRHPVPEHHPATDLSQFRDTTRQEISMWPAYKTGKTIYPYQDARRKK